MWGTWWAWDPRLTSFLILFLFYLGYIALWSAIEDPDTAADLTSVLCLVGSVFAVLSRYAVNFWNQGLHQGASLSLDKEENVADVFWFPLLVCIAGFVLLFVALCAAAHADRDPRAAAPGLGRGSGWHDAGPRAIRGGGAVGLRGVDRADRGLVAVSLSRGRRVRRELDEAEARQRPMAKSPLMILPPVIFAGLAAMFYLGMQRDDPDALPSARVGRAWRRRWC
jgi:hypothetical protein